MKTKPSVVANYNVHMIGVDGMDQLTSYYSFTHKTVKWWRKVFFWMVEVALVNTYIIHKKLQQSIEMPAKSHITLRREILIELCKPLMQLPKPPRRISSDHSLERLQNKQHFSEKHSKRKDCRVCSARDGNGERHTTPFVCSTCSDSSSLCPGNCFRIYHTQLNFRQ